MNRQNLLILIIIIGGSTLGGLAYGVTNGSIIVGDLTVTNSCSGCLQSQTITYTGDGSVVSRHITVGFQPKIILIQAQGNNAGGFIITNQTYLFGHIQSGGSTFHFNGADNGLYTGVNRVDVGNLNNAFSNINDLGVVYDMTILR